MVCYGFFPLSPSRAGNGTGVRGDRQDVWKIGERPELIAKDVVISEEFGIYRSFRRGATLEATNRKVPKEVIEVNNRW